MADEPLGAWANDRSTSITTTSGSIQRTMTTTSSVVTVVFMRVLIEESIGTLRKIFQLPSSTTLLPTTPSLSTTSMAERKTTSVLVVQPVLAVCRESLTRIGL